MYEATLVTGRIMPGPVRPCAKRHHDYQKRYRSSCSGGYHPRRQPDHQSARAPIRQIEVEVEPALHQFGWIGFEIAPFIRVRKARGRDPRPCRQIPEGLAIRLAERSVDRLKLEVLVFAHGCGRRGYVEDGKQLRRAAVRGG